ncbi:hypothetical protein FNV43_RR00267 [Rhamnella rubrinervis]|uniref:Uncharacterized protein n=1 Tax=Rhamnella rubrinervis TaxID=2594499 RepID=A0A8K0MS86_9ROSA|nr:hypothetical protein FNV43_RR00267 [Rhamnella rubrinervis]
MLSVSITDIGERDDIPSIIHIPKQIALEKLVELIPLEWFTRYERIHKPTTPLLSMDPSFHLFRMEHSTSFSKPSSRLLLHEFSHSNDYSASKPCNPDLEKEISC